ncbi:MAG: 16S rRNA (uracil(1498)-N(3))-methyltransferase [Desulfobacteraceae bacterium]|jgi:16S rRNA (uracil1498-N3)-methyltransferase|nr:16S rRNA (uracil(1498)-N(3))-methyltransferase [Desulfobacteraceae bacterium]MDD3993209.1 16S rRNA (uracil(1498)-N(3))-methyltransferase [Desulfobacteraceae bacterium]
MRRFLIAPDIPENAVAILSPEDSRHLVQVLRLRAGDSVQLFDGRGMEYQGTVATLHPDGVRVTVGRRQPTTAESPLELMLLQGFLKETKMDLLVRQLTEVGLSHLVPFLARRSVARPDSRRLAGRLARWRKIAAEALKQCRRGKIPSIDFAGDLDAALVRAENCDLKIVFWETAQRPLGDIVSQLSAPVHSVALLLGPEGGFEAEEVAAAQAAGFAVASLGPRILRAETAALVACALIQHRLGDLG